MNLLLRCSLYYFQRAISLRSVKRKSTPFEYDAKKQELTIGTKKNHRIAETGIGF